MQSEGERSQKCRREKGREEQEEQERGNGREEQDECARDAREIRATCEGKRFEKETQRHKRAVGSSGGGMRMVMMPTMRRSSTSSRRMMMSSTSSRRMMSSTSSRRMKGHMDERVEDPLGADMLVGAHRRIRGLGKTLEERIRSVMSNT